MGELLHGLDVSDWQPRVNWRLVSAHAGWMMTEVGYATSTQTAIAHDGRDHLHEARRCGLKVGAYFFAYPGSKVSAAEQGAFAARQVAGVDLDLPLALDLEVNPCGLTKTALRQWVEDWLKGTGLDPKRLAVYASPGFWNAAVDTSTPVNAHCWVAAYGAPSAPRLDGLPLPFAWQFSQAGRVPGIPGAVDLDVLLFDPQK